MHAFYYAIWKRFGALPERYNWQLQAPDVLFYPLRPELVESTYLLYQVWVCHSSPHGGQVQRGSIIGDSTFEWVARRAVRALWNLRSNETGLLGNVVNIQTGQWVGMQSGLGAGMDSFYEYLLKSYILVHGELFSQRDLQIPLPVNPGTFSFQLFDDDNPLHKSENKYIFTTEGHVVPIDARFREKQWNDLFPCEERVVTDQETSNGSFSIHNINCDRVSEERRYSLPLKSVYMRQIDHMVGLF
ncbi:ER degradation-enhancing alpha-mannosidase-like protein 1 [Oncorhynchus nerka]|uniref:ER degradation-enhancing alpha-mannosidase-like protein 1 n=1 Tax=Oncorhynchus nerka TaxID=8023 RepID=UPI0031B852BE